MRGARRTVRIRQATRSGRRCRLHVLAAARGRAIGRRPSAAGRKLSPMPVLRLAALLLTAAVVLPAVSGCATAVLTDMGGGARPDGRSAAEIARDADIEAAVQARFARDPQLAPSALEVRVRDGVVHLSGRVATARLRERAVRLARGVPGVRRVLVRVTVAGP